MISRRQGGGNKAYCTYVEEADDAANKDSALIYNWHKIGLCLEIAVQAGKIIDAKVGKQNTGKPDEGKDGHALSPPAPDMPRMQHNCVDKPSDKRPCLLGIPTPIRAPGVMRPNGTSHYSDGEKNKTKSGALIN